MKKEKCSPKLDPRDFSCYSNQQLQEMKLLWNKHHPERPILTNTPQDIHLRLGHRLSRNCNTESCWQEQDFMKKNVDNIMKNHTFAPKAPPSWKKNKWEWLSSIEIDEIMKQYEHTYPCFKFIGPSPIDFDKKLSYNECVWDELCKFDIKQFIKDKKKKIGMAFNLDPHDKEGSHWVGMFVNIPKAKIYYFDSNGIKMPRKINKLVKRIIKQGNSLGIEFQVEQNYPVSHQRRDSECGIYVLYFLVEMIKDKPFRHFKNKKLRIKDKFMNRLRRRWFN